VNFKNF